MQLFPVEVGIFWMKIGSSLKTGYPAGVFLRGAKLLTKSSKGAKIFAKNSRALKFSLFWKTVQLGIRIENDPPDLKNRP